MYVKIIFCVSSVTLFYSFLSFFCHFPLFLSFLSFSLISNLFSFFSVFSFTHFYLFSHIFLIFPFSFSFFIFFTYARKKCTPASSITLFSLISRYSPPPMPLLYPLPHISSFLQSFFPSCTLLSLPPSLPTPCSPSFPSSFPQTRATYQKLLNMTRTIINVSVSCIVT